MPGKPARMLAAGGVMTPWFWLLVAALALGLILEALGY